MGAVLALNLAALAVLARLVFVAPVSEAAAGEGTAAAPPPAFVALPEPAPARDSLAEAERRSLEGDLRAIVARWTDRAREEARGRLDPAEVAVSVHVRELGGGRAGEVALDADRPLRPASNLKLVTTAAALVLLGPAHRFETRFEVSGPIEGGTLRGDLVVRAGGDPLYDPDARGAVDHLLAPAVEALGARGVVAIGGDLVLDEGSFPRPAPGPAWPDASQHWTDYCALAGGLTVNRGCLTATVEPSQPGSPASVSVRPRDHGLAESLGVRTERGGKILVRVGAKPAGVVVSGQVPARSPPWTGSFAHPDPVELFGHALWGALARRGIQVEGRLRRERGARGGELVARLASPLSATLVPINAHSENAVADQVFLATALAVEGEASREAGARATARALARLGVPSDGLVQVDGSGLSRQNRITARQVTALVAAVLGGEPESARLYRESLAVAGESGTLADRMREGPARGRVRAKTGFIAGASALSGVARTAGGRELAFSILVSYPPVDGLNRSAWKPMQDEICARLVEVGP